MASPLKRFKKEMSEETKLIDGRKMAQTIRKELKDEISTMTPKPGLAVVLVGNRPDSATYVRMKKKAAKETKKKRIEKKKKKSKEAVKKNKRSNSKKACQDVQSISTDGVLNSSMNKLDVVEREPLNKEEQKETTIASPYEVNICQLHN